MNAQNQYTSVGGITATYDNNGNLTTDPTTGNNYSYDAWNRLVSVTNGSSTLAAYQYDARGRRIVETHSGVSTALYYNKRWQVIEERVAGQTQVQYVWSPAGVDRQVLRDSNPDINGNLTLRLYVQQDANGNVTSLVDVNGNVVERFASTPYGTVIVLNPDFTIRGTSNYDWRYFWQGKRRDMGLDDSRGRIYSPSMMRTLQADPLDLGPDINGYRWEGDNPVNRTDPSGLITDDYGFSDSERAKLYQEADKRRMQAARKKAIAIRDATIAAWIDSKTAYSKEEKERLKKEIQEIMDAADNMEWDKPVGYTGNCNDWVEKFEKTLRARPKRERTNDSGIRRFTSATGLGSTSGLSAMARYLARGEDHSWSLYDIDVQRFKNRYDPRGGAHAALRITFRDGTELYLDDGNWGGLDHVFMPGEVGSAYTPQARPNQFYESNPLDRQGPYPPGWFTNEAANQDAFGQPLPLPKP